MEEIKKRIELERALNHYKDSLEDYQERFKIYPTTTYSRPYLYIYLCCGNIEVWAVDERCTDQLFADEILEEIEELPTLEELIEIYNHYSKELIK